MHVSDAPSVKRIQLEKIAVAVGKFVFIAIAALQKPVFPQRFAVTQASFITPVFRWSEGKLVVIAFRLIGPLEIIDVGNAVSVAFGVSIRTFSSEGNATSFLVETSGDIEFGTEIVAPAIS